ncbi:MAG TPA: DUF4193 family protein [Acidimicrobiia bacterium]|nr:DUF4193 family protein [Acidimicrobiia bacterium]
MSDDTLEDKVDVDLEDADLDEDLEDDDLTEEGDDDAIVGADALATDVVADDVEPKVPKAKPRVKKTEEDDDADGDDLDEELHPDDVETPLDALLKEKTASAKMEDDEDELEDDEPDGDEPVEGSGRIQPRRASEFHCSSCFLLLPRSQLADEERMLCRDCI